MCRVCLCTCSLACGAGRVSRRFVHGAIRWSMSRSFAELSRCLSVGLDGFLSHSKKSSLEGGYQDREGIRRCEWKKTSLATGRHERRSEIGVSSGPITTRPLTRLMNSASKRCCVLDLEAIVLIDVGSGEAVHIACGSHHAIAACFQASAHNPFVIGDIAGNQLCPTPCRLIISGLFTALPSTPRSTRQKPGLTPNLTLPPPPLLLSQ
ncbi:hypothetical protein FKP32DRAFT_1117099 [Trametes sanguinea]|nr:hypothetical protein FKP32DRAFT_1117099 [Trametes sanguinea]